ncbi:hypothetical protein RB653_008033 [Dictyostelium firmibasis]|uniref:Uncharacterized protein n=1 Tax=Dictyostelium firmibasis TaxID=79012 RepID=A0AAN7TZI0_9MYCE
MELLKKSLSVVKNVVCNFLYEKIKIDEKINVDGIDSGPGMSKRLTTSTNINVVLVLIIALIIFILMLDGV